MAGSILAAQQRFTSPAHRTRARRNIVCRAQQERSAWQQLGAKMAAASAALVLSGSSLAPAVLASEFDLLNEERPTDNYILDDARVVNKTTRSTLQKKLKTLEIETGYRLEVITVRRLEFETDAFAFGDKLLENWYPSVEEGTNKGVLLVVTAAKDGAVTGGPKFLGAVGDELIDSIVSNNIPIFTEDEKYNETITSSVARIEAILKGEADPGAPERPDDTRKRTYKTKEEVEATKSVSTTIFITLLVISVVVPMLQYYGYVAKD